jgi:hypothetical protein
MVSQIYTMKRYWASLGLENINRGGLYNWPASENGGIFGAGHF